jgi:hypothetical protein
LQLMLPNSLPQGPLRSSMRKLEAAFLMTQSAHVAFCLFFFSVHRVAAMLCEHKLGDKRKIECYSRRVLQPCSMRCATV